MAYCRKGPDSDCYIIGTGDGYECLCCTLAEELTLPGGSKMHDSFFCRTPTELYHHMLDHVMRGEKVPLSAMERAKAEGEDRVWVDPELVLLELLERLVSPRETFDAIVRSAIVTKLLDEVLERCFQDEWERWPIDFFDEDGPEDYYNGPDFSDWPGSGSGGT